MKTLSTAVRPFLCAALAVAGLVAADGCKDKMMDGNDSSMMDTSGMSKDQLMQKGQEMVSNGNTMQTNASAMPDGQQKDDMMTKAKAMIQKGMDMLSKAKGM